jgi:hypothetical protein
MSNAIITSRKTDIISLPTEMISMVLNGKKTEEECDGMLLIVPDGDLKLYK